MRVYRNPYVAEWETRPGEIQPFPMQAMLSRQNQVMGGIGGQIDGLDRDRSCFAMGQGAGGIRAVLTCREIVERTMAEAEEVLGRLSALGTVAGVASMQAEP